MTHCLAQSPCVSLLSTDVPGASITGRRYGHGRLVYRDLLAPTLPRGRPWSCLDVGTGNGYLLSLLARDADAVTALEPDETKKGSIGTNLNGFLRLTIDYNKVEEAALGRYSYVLACHSLYNVVDRRAVCDKLCEALECGGRAVIVYHTTLGTYDLICEAGLRAEGRPFAAETYRVENLAESMRARRDGRFAQWQAELGLWLGSPEQATAALVAQLRCETTASRAAIAAAVERQAAATHSAEGIMLTCIDAVLIFDRTVCSTP